jgi:nicotinate-nucleotide adenylyltransferase
MNPMVHIALFGTSADPPTVGHQIILEKLAVRFDVVAAWAASNPFKPNQTPLVHRQAMLALLVEELQPHYLNVQFRPQLSHPRTLHSLQIAQQIWPGSQFTLAVGSDILDSLPNWYAVSELLRQVNLLIVPRPGTPITPAHHDVLQRLGACFTVADFMGPDVSSTTYRQTQSETEAIPVIANYIRQHQLYNPADDFTDFTS